MKRTDLRTDSNDSIGESEGFSPHYLMSPSLQVITSDSSISPLDEGILCHSVGVQTYSNPDRSVQTSNFELTEREKKPITDLPGNEDEHE